MTQFSLQWILSLNWLSQKWGQVQQRFSERHKEFQRNQFDPVEMVSAESIIAGGTTSQAIPLASFQNTNKRTLLIFNTYTFDSASILMVEILVEGNGKSRIDTKFISWVPGQDPQFVDDPRAEKSRLPASPLFITPIQYGEQRKALPESALVKKIWQRPRWCICSRPEEFKKARFRDLDQCAQFAASANVRSQSRWTQYPWIATSPEYNNESIAGEIELEDSEITHLERWVLFRSGQFVHNLALWISKNRFVKLWAIEIGRQTQPQRLLKALRLAQNGPGAASLWHCFQLYKRHGRGTLYLSASEGSAEPTSSTLFGFVNGAR